MNEPTLTLEQLKQFDVLATEPNKQKEAEKQEIETKIKSLAKGATFGMKLNAEQIAFATRKSIECHLPDWKSWLKREIEEQILNSKIGKSTITGPSFASGKKVTAPSQWTNA